MKRNRRRNSIRSQPVAPHAGAWIETSHEASCPITDIVAPHAGAWIETLSRRVMIGQAGVAPHAGAWIET